MKKYYLIILAFNLIIGCKNNYNYKRNLDNSIKDSINSSSKSTYLVSQIVTITKKGNEDTMKFNYDSLNRKIEVLQKRENIYFSYDQYNNLARIKTVNKYRISSDLDDTIIYSKKNIDMISKNFNLINRLKLNSKGLVEEMKIEKIGKEEELKIDKSEFYTYQYDDSDNLITMTRYNKNLCTKTKFEYDNKHYPFICMGGNNKVTVFQKNNILKKIIYDCKTDSIIDTILYDYEYNENGYPTIQKIKNQNENIIMKYQYITIPKK